MNVPVEGSTLFVKQVRGDNICKLMPVGDKVGLKRLVDQIRWERPEPRSPADKRPAEASVTSHHLQ
jgi:hypothetical protein